MCTLIKINGIYNNPQKFDDFNVYKQILIDVDKRDITVDTCEHTLTDMNFDQALYNFSGDSFILNNINVYLNYLELVKEDKDIPDFININGIAEILFNYIILYYEHSELTFSIINFKEDLNSLKI